MPDSEGGGGLAETFFNPEKQGWLTKEGICSFKVVILLLCECLGCFAFRVYI